MNLFAKEYRGIVGASAFALLSIGGSGAFLWQSLERANAAMLAMQKRTKEFETLRKESPAPTEESRKQLEKQKEASTASVGRLRAALNAMNVPLEKIQPQEFQTALNAKTQSFIAKAAKSKIPIPPGARESDFSMDLDEFIKRMPSVDQVSSVNRQLTAADRLLNTLLDSKPMALASFKIDRADDLKEAKTDPKPEAKPEPKGGKPGQPQAKPMAPALSVLGFDLKFTASPDSLRDFLNALARDKQAFYVVRRLKIATLSKEGIPMLAPSKAGGTPPTPSTSSGQPQSSPVAQYILGDEHVEVEARVDLLTVLPPPAASNPPAKSPSTSPAKEGAKQP